MVDDDGRTPDHGHPISSPCEPSGSGELKIGIPLHAQFLLYKWDSRGYTCNGHVILIICSTCDIGVTMS